MAIEIKKNNSRTGMSFHGSFSENWSVTGRINSAAELGDRKSVARLTLLGMALLSGKSQAAHSWLVKRGEHCGVPNEPE